VERQKVLGTSIDAVATAKEYRDWYMDLLAALKRDKSVKGNLRHEWRRKFKLELRRIESFFAILDRETVQARAETIH
jgi:hypothetical protein